MGTGWMRSTAGTARTTRLTETLARANDRGAPHAILLTETRRLSARARWERHRAATFRLTGRPAAPSVYRVEHQVGQQLVADLGSLEGTSPHPTVLTPFISALRLAGVTAGRVVLRDASSGRVVACRALAPSGQSAT